MENSAFRNQLSYRTFNESFDNTNDVMYMLLNELDSNIVISANDNPQQLQILVDPRTKQQVTRTVCDRTRPKRWNVFRSNQRSRLSESEQKACMRVSVGLAQNLSVKEEDLTIWRETKKTRENEETLVQNLAREHTQQYKEILYAPMKSLVTNFRIYYQSRVNPLLKELPNTTFITHLGMPKVQVCTTLNNDPATIEEICMVERKGSVLLWEGDVSEDLYKCGDAVHHQLQKLIHANPKVQLQNQPQTDSLESHTFELPMESLIFLLTVGDYIDVPNEMLLEIDDGLDELKRIKFHLPLPSTNCGWHTNSELVQKAFDSYLSVPGRAKWLNVMNETVSLEQPYEAPEIIGCTGEGKPNKYKMHKFDDYMMNLPSDKTLETNDNFCKSNCALVSWKLQSSNSEMPPLNFITTLQIPASLDERCDKLLGCNFIKFENKPRFGCEIMTKYELLKAWFQLKLLKSDTGRCVRLDLETFLVLLNQKFTLHELEQKLVKHYRIHIDILLGKLHEFLNMLVRFPAGKYLLRFNPKYCNQIMLCKPASEVTQNAVNLHEMLLAPATDFAFMAQENYLAIDSDLCSAMHLQHQILPGAFSTDKRLIKKSSATEQTKLYKERQRILKKVTLKRATVKKDRKNKKKRKKTKNHADNGKAKLDQAQNTYDDIEVDKIFTL